MESEREKEKEKKERKRENGCSLYDRIPSFHLSFVVCHFSFSSLSLPNCQVKLGRELIGLEL